MDETECPVTAREDSVSHASDDMLMKLNSL
jgi:hypothetical protein